MVPLYLSSNLIFSVTGSSNWIQPHPLWLRGPLPEPLLLICGCLMEDTTRYQLRVCISDMMPIPLQDPTKGFVNKETHKIASKTQIYYPFLFYGFPWLQNPPLGVYFTGFLGYEPFGGLCYGFPWLRTPLWYDPALAIRLLISNIQKSTRWNKCVQSSQFCVCTVTMSRPLHLANIN